MEVPDFSPLGILGFPPIMGKTRLKASRIEVWGQIQRNSIELLDSLKADDCFFASINAPGYLIALTQPLLTIWISVP